MPRNQPVGNASQFLVEVLHNASCIDRKALFLLEFDMWNYCHPMICIIIGFIEPFWVSYHYFGMGYHDSLGFILVEIHLSMFD